MWPDLDIDAGLSLTDHLLNRIQAFHDFIGLDTSLLSDAERLNTRAMYRIYKEKKLPEQDDKRDHVAAYQRGTVLLQRIQAEDPELWDLITNMPDGIRSALQVSSPADDNAEAVSFARSVLAIEGAQIPLISPGQQVGVASPFDAPKPGEALVLLSSGEVTEAYAVSDDLEPRKVTAAQLITAAECSPDTPPTPLPAKSNERVMAAFEAFKGDVRASLGRSRRPASDTRLRR